MAIIVAVALFTVSRASAGTAVVVAGPEGSARVAAIVSELRGRGFDVVTVASSGASDAATVRVEDDGAVLVVAGDHRETFSAAESDAIIARRVAEAIRAAATVPEPAAVPLPAPAPPPAPAAVPLPAPAPSQPPPARAPARSPSRTFALAGTWLLSVDDALPIIAIGAGGNPLSTEGALRVGDPAYGSTASPKPMSLDVAVSDRLTVGGTVLVQVGSGSATVDNRSSILGASARLGYVIPLGDRVALWPRLGVAHASALDGGSALTSRTDLVAEARLVWSVSPSWALTLGPSIALPFQHEARSSEQGPYAVGPGAGFTYPTTVAPRIALAIGITGRIKDGSEEQAQGAPAREPRYFVGIERAIPLLRYRLDTKAGGEQDETGAGPLSAGTADVTTIAPQTPRLAFDVRVRETLTVGVAASIGYVRTTRFAGDLLPKSGSPDTLAWAISPRVGVRAPLSRTLALWPRLGLTYANAASSRADTGDFSAHHLGVDLDGFAVFSPVEGVGFLIGPSFALPLTGARQIVTAPDGTGKATVKRQEQGIFTIGLSAGLVVSFP